jgi:heterodisulfide reductase subunit B
MQLIKAAQCIRNDDLLRREMSDIVSLEVTGSTRVLNLIQVFQAIGLPVLKDKVKCPINTIKAACYYGCLLTRPPEVVDFDDFEQPRSMEGIAEALGATTVEWNYKTECCGAGMTMANEETVLDLSHKILANAADHGANCIVVACPMCHVNLDMKQDAVEMRYGVKHNMVVYYLSDLVGMALGLPAQTIGIDRHFVVTA